MLISESYREQNRLLHSSGTFGFKGYHYAKEILPLCDALRTRDILDYGCGQKSLEREMGFPIKNYDPAVEGLDKLPEPADVVACTDVLEHIEPDCLDAVLDDLRRITKYLGYFVIDTRLAVKTLPDGRNAHLIVEDGNWWFPKFHSRWTSVQVNHRYVRPGKTCGLTVIVRP